jgi:hypothetical protein
MTSKSVCTSEATTGEINKLAAEITDKICSEHGYSKREHQGTWTDKRGYAGHLLFAVRTVDNLLRQGLPHLKIGERRVRICILEADRWMCERFGQQRSRRVRITDPLP